MYSSETSIMHALFTIMDKKALPDVTMREIAQEAGVSRATLYRHFSSPEDIVRRWLRELCRKVVTDQDSWEPNSREAILHAFTVLYGERDTLRCLARQGLDHEVARAMYDATLYQVRRLDVLHSNYQIYYFAGASMGLLSCWTRGGMKESPEEITDIFIELLHGYMDVHSSRDQ